MKRQEVLEHAIRETDARFISPSGKYYYDLGILVHDKGYAPYTIHSSSLAATTSYAEQIKEVRKNLKQEVSEDGTYLTHSHISLVQLVVKPSDQLGDSLFIERYPIDDQDGISLYHLGTKGNFDFDFPRILREFSMEQIQKLSNTLLVPRDEIDELSSFEKLIFQFFPDYRSFLTQELVRMREDVIRRL